MIYAKIKNHGKISVCCGTVSDSVKNETAKFKLPKEWENYKKTAVFRYADQLFNVILNKKSNLCISEDECYIPHRVIKSPRYTLSVFFARGVSKATAIKNLLIGGDRI